MDGDVPRRPSYVVYISQLIRFARVCSHVNDFDARNTCLTAKLLKQGIISLERLFSKFYRRHHKLVTKLIQCRIRISFTLRPIGTRILWRLSIKFKMIMGRADFSEQF